MLYTLAQNNAAAQKLDPSPRAKIKGVKERRPHYRGTLSYYLNNVKTEVFLILSAK